MKSIIQADREHCFICGRNSRADYWGLDEHHVFGGYSNGNRDKSEQYGLKIYICHDRCHLNGVHKDAELNRKVQAVVQKRAMCRYGWSIDDFRNIFGRNFID
jgi:hypothetical protein